MRRSRTTRFWSEASGGWPVVFWRRIANLPSWPAVLAAAAAEVMAASDRPASSSRVSTMTAAALISLRTFWLNWVESFASSAFRALSLVLSASASLAPPRTKSL